MKPMFAFILLVCLFHGVISFSKLSTTTDTYSCYDVTGPLRMHTKLLCKPNTYVVGFEEKNKYISLIRCCHLRRSTTKGPLDWKNAVQMSEYNTHDLSHTKQANLGFEENRGVIGTFSHEDYTNYIYSTIVQFSHDVVAVGLASYTVDGPSYMGHYKWDMKLEMPLGEVGTYFSLYRWVWLPAYFTCPENYVFQSMKNVYFKGPTRLYLVNCVRPRLQCGMHTYEKDGECHCNDGYKKAFDDRGRVKGCQVCKQDGYYCEEGSEKECPMGYACPKGKKKKCDTHTAAHTGLAHCIHLPVGCSVGHIGGTKKHLGPIACKECYKSTNSVIPKNGQCTCSTGTFFQDYDKCVTCPSDHYKQRVSNSGDFQYACAPIEFQVREPDQYIAKTGSISRYNAHIIIPDGDLKNAVIDVGLSQESPVDAPRIFDRKGASELHFGTDKYVIDSGTNKLVITPNIPAYEKSGVLEFSVDLASGRIYSFWISIRYPGQQGNAFATDTKWHHYVFENGCSCSIEEPNNDTPQVLNDTRGFFNPVTSYICPTWFDNSLCDVSYSISRKMYGKNQPYENVGSLVANTGSCMIVDNTNICDNVITQQYPVGLVLGYKVSVNHNKQINSKFYNLNAAIEFNYTVPWVANIDISASIGDTAEDRTTFTNYTVYIMNYDEVLYVTNVTDAMGRTHVTVSMHNVSERNQRIWINATKITEFENGDLHVHDIACTNFQGSVIPCQENRQTVTHLQQAIFTITDLSMVVATGELTYKDTKQLTSDNTGCPVVDREVCAHDIQQGDTNSLFARQPICVNVTAQGTYKFSLFEGRKYEIIVSEHNFQFKAHRDRDYPKLAYLEQKYGAYHLSAEGTDDLYLRPSIKGLDFLALRTSKFGASYFGGLCKIPLQGGSFEITSPTCPKFLTYMVIHPSVIKVAKKLPAMAYSIRMIPNKDMTGASEFTVEPRFRADLFNFFSNIVQTADLREGHGGVEFIYNGFLNAEIELYGEKNCIGLGPLLQVGNYYDMEVIFTQIFPGEGTCNKFGDDASVVIYDKISAPKSPTEDCSRGCLPDKFLPHIGIATYGVTAGKPNFYQDYTRDVIIELTIGQKVFPTVRRSVVIEGVWEDGAELASYAIPKWRPLSIVYDPPGDGSFATFEKGSVVTTTDNAPPVYPPKKTSKLLNPLLGLVTEESYNKRAEAQANGEVASKYSIIRQLKGKDPESEGSGARKQRLREEAAAQRKKDADARNPNNGKQSVASQKAAQDKGLKAEREQNKITAGNDPVKLKELNDATDKKKREQARERKQRLIKEKEQKKIEKNKLKNGTAKGKTKEEKKAAKENYKKYKKDSKSSIRAGAKHKIKEGLKEANTDKRGKAKQAGKNKLKSLAKSALIKKTPNPNKIGLIPDIDVGLSTDLEQDINICVAFLTLIGCIKAAEFTATASINLSSKSTSSTERNYEESETKTSTQSYSTSAYAGFSNGEADLIIVPTVRMLSTMTYELYVAVDSSNKEEHDMVCQPRVRSVVKSREAADTTAANAISAVTVYDIKNVEIPQMQANQKALRTGEEFDPTLYLQLQEGIDGWKETLKLHSLLRAHNGEPMTFYRTAEQISDKVDPKKIPEEQLAAGGVGNFAAFNRLTFYGGGAALSYGVTVERSRDTFHKSEHTSQATLDFYAAATVLAMEIPLVSKSTPLYWNSNKTDQEKNDIESISTSFTLTDGDRNDFFDVEVFQDPLFSTANFKTISGRSQCPHEPGTIRRENFHLRLPGHSGIYRDLDPDETFYLEFEIVNENVDEDKYGTFRLDPATNQHGLQIATESNAAEISYLIPKLETGEATQETTKVIVAVTRGSGYKFEDVTFELVSQCEMDLYNGDGLTSGYYASKQTISMYYLEPCASVKWWGDFRFLETFHINNNTLDKVMVMIKNEGEPFYLQDRLQYVELHYRPKGSAEWRTAVIHGHDNAYFYKKGTEEEEAINHEIKLFSTLDWDTSLLLNGEYELRVHSACRKSRNVIYDNSYTPVLHGYVDRDPPIFLSLPEPANGVFKLGDTISATFNEALDCSRPYEYGATLRIPGADRIYKINSRLLESGSAIFVTYCENNRISLMFNAQLDYQLLMGNDAEISLCGVRDVSGNIQNCLSWNFYLEPIDITYITTEINLNITADMFLSKMVVEELSNEIETLIELPKNSIQINLATVGEGSSNVTRSLVASIRLQSYKEKSALASIHALSNALQFMFQERQALDHEWQSSFQRGEESRRRGRRSIDLDLDDLDVDLDVDDLEYEDDYEPPQKDPSQNGEELDTAIDPAMRQHISLTAHNLFYLNQVNMEKPLALMEVGDASTITTTNNDSSNMEPVREDFDSNRDIAEEYKEKEQKGSIITTAIISVGFATNFILLGCVLFLSITVLRRKRKDKKAAVQHVE